MFNRIVSGVAAIAMMLVAGSAGAQVLFQNTFDSNTEGWGAIGSTGSTGLTATQVAGELTQSPPSGSLDTTGTSFFLSPISTTPGSFLAALRTAIGGSISYDIRSTHVNSQDTFYAFVSDFQIGVGTNRLRYVFPVTPSFPTHVSLNFNTSSPWLFYTNPAGSGVVATQANIDSMVQSATSLAIRAEYWTSGSASASPQTAFLDNVTITAVPESETYAMMLAGLGLLGFIVRRRKESRQTL